LVIEKDNAAYAKENESFASSLINIRRRFLPAFIMALTTATLFLRRVSAAPGEAGGAVAR